jgi:hypothetical protein
VSICFNSTSLSFHFFGLFRLTRVLTRPGQTPTHR